MKHLVTSLLAASAFAEEPAFKCDNNVAVVYLIDATNSLKHHELQKEVEAAEAMHKKLSDKVEGKLKAAVYIFGGKQHDRDSFARMDMAPGTFTLVKEDAFCDASNYVLTQIVGAELQGKKLAGTFTLKQCAKECKIGEQCRYFNFGKKNGQKEGECHLQYTRGETCPEGLRSDSSYDFYKIGDNFDALESRGNVFENLSTMVKKPRDFRGRLFGKIPPTYSLYRYGTFYKEALHESYRVLGNTKAEVEIANASLDEKENWTYLSVLVTDGESGDCSGEQKNNQCKPKDEDIQVATVHLGHAEGATKKIYPKLAAISGCDSWKSGEAGDAYFAYGTTGENEEYCPYMISRVVSSGKSSVGMYDWAETHAEKIVSHWVHNTDRYCPAGHAIIRNPLTQKLYCDKCPYGSAITEAQDMCMGQTTECNKPPTPEAIPEPTPVEPPTYFFETNPEPTTPEPTPEEPEIYVEETTPEPTTEEPTTEEPTTPEPTPEEPEIYVEETTPEPTTSKPTQYSTTPKPRPHGCFKISRRR